MDILTKRGRLFWKVVGLVSLTLFVYMALPFIDVMVYGLFIYYVAKPVYKRINDKIESKNISAALSLFLIILPVLMILSYAAIVASFELSNLLEKIDYSLPEEYDLNKIVGELGKAGEDLTPEKLWLLIESNVDLKDILTQHISILESAFGSLANIALKLFLTFLIGFYLLKDGIKLRQWFSQLSGKENTLTERFMDSVNKDLHRIFFGNVLVAVLTSIIAIILFGTLNHFAPQGLTVPYVFLISLLCGISIFIPAIGIKIVWVPLYLYLIGQALLQGILISALPFFIVSIILVFLLVDISPDIILRPLISSRDIHAGILILSYMFGVIVFGFKGLFLGPLIIVFATNFIHKVLPELMK